MSAAHSARTQPVSDFRPRVMASQAHAGAGAIRRPAPVEPANHHSAAHNDRHLLAERYKTKMCRNYVRDGVCPYEYRCMFAHGDHELRTCEMNLDDGLVTEEAIKAFQRGASLRARQRVPAPAIAASTASQPTHQQRPRPAHAVQHAAMQQWDDASSCYGDEPAGESSDPRSQPVRVPVEVNEDGDVVAYRYNPYCCSIIIPATEECASEGACTVDEGEYFGGDSLCSSPTPLKAAPGGALEP